MRHSPIRRLLAAALGCFSLGCYVGRPIEPATAVTGTRVQLQLTEQGTTLMASQLGPSRVQLMGDVTASTDSSLVLAVRTITDRRGVEEIWTGEQVTVPLRAVASAERRSVSGSRSTLFALGAALLVGAIGAALHNVGTGGGPAGEGGSSQ